MVCMVSCCVQLDAGSPEKVLLSASDPSESLLIAKYSELRRILNESFEELALSARPRKFPCVRFICPEKNFLCVNA